MKKKPPLFKSINARVLTPYSTEAGHNKPKRWSEKETPSKPGPKAFSEIITKKAISQKGVFSVHFQDDKYFFEIPDNLLGRELIAVTRFAKVAAGASKYGGEVANEQTLQFEKGPGNRIFMRVVTLINRADSTQTIAKAVKNSNLDPIVAAFDIKAYGKDSTSSIIEVTDFLKAITKPLA